MSGSPVCALPTCFGSLLLRFVRDRHIPDNRSVASVAGDEEPGVSGTDGVTGSDGPRGPPGSQLRWAWLAAVSDVGTLVRGQNVTAASRLNSDRYMVTFNSNVEVANGYYFATPGLTGNWGVSGKPAFSANYSAPNSVHVEGAYGAATSTVHSASSDSTESWAPHLSAYGQSFNHSTMTSPLHSPRSRATKRDADRLWERLPPENREAASARPVALLRSRRRGMKRR